ncbi:hypothetical protein E0L93_02250 [Rubrobacter taiwanensis]|jgi:hypothetical protein|uniref:Uncharacterized protein n=1 Tax=Rubrobacter taiwanensis TaxID=185139 RepID=A0A4R1BQD6_9ACTN|nr:hypothetical protein [Rubrobacter taiwanensis]TCJ19801.1 hypothetical protein E0L93_02250 [Rubrobacter taiwanensis]
MLATALAVAAAFLLNRLLRQPRYSARRLSPETIVNYEPPEEDEEPSPEQLSRFIVERAEEIHRTLLESPDELQVEMCALGYRACVEDMITLTHRVNEELREAGPLRRARLNASKRRAADALYRVRQELPPSALRATRQQQ